MSWQTGVGIGLYLIVGGVITAFVEYIAEPSEQDLFKVERDNPIPWLVAILWPVVLPFVVLYSAYYLASAPTRRRRMREKAVKELGQP